MESNDNLIVGWMVGDPNNSPALYNRDQHEEALNAASRWNSPITAIVVHPSAPQSLKGPLDFVKALKIAEVVFENYRQDQPKWWRKMDGTPILNDIAVRMAEAFRDEASQRSP